MDRYLNENKKRTKDEAFKATTEPTAKKFMDKLRDALIYGIESNQNTSQVIFLDKNHVPNAIERTINTIEKHGITNSKRVKVLKVALVPDQVSTHSDFPFSLSFLL